ncbi:putrescine-binding periplasmic protein PotF [Salvia divinorum]|uniref:Putrescine-binding periplasmic protein PotF n=1 Tax=Salvia divinorum TaxID=28513 RepID=A0ABD1ILB1_SALDI
MAVLLLPSLLGLSYPDPNPTRHRIRCNRYQPTNHWIKLAAASNGKGCSQAEDFLRKLSVSSVFLIGVGISSLWAFPHPASAQIPPSSSAAQEILDEDNVGKVENSGDFEDTGMNAAFERWKSKSYALSVPLRIVALEGSIPPVWIREFLKSQGKRVQFRPEFRRSIGDIFHELSNPLSKGKISPKSAVSADLVTLGDSWLNFSIGKGLIEPMKGIEEQDWFQDLSDKWKVYLRRSADGGLDSQGKIWAMPYRWGSIVIAYNNKEFKRHKLAPVKDWSDLWRPELAGKISMVDSPREIIGAVLKYMGSSYNTTNIDSQVVGGKNAVLQQLNLLVKQVRLFDSQHYLKAFRAGDVWVAVGWSSDVLPVAKTMSNVSVMVPKSGASLWADFWVIPTTSRLATDQIGGRIRGPSPLVQQWVEFCLQPERALPFKEEVVAGASPVSLKAPDEQPRELKKGRPKLETNLVGNVPPADILSKCELLEPLSEDAISDYEWLICSLPKPSHSVVTTRLKHALSSLVPTFWSKMQSKAT